MQIHLTARHCELGPDVRSFAEQRLGKLQRYDDGIHEVRVIVSAERKIHTAEITLRAHQQDLVITESHTDVIAALELAADRLEDRVRRNKDRRVSAPRREARNGGPTPPEPTADSFEGDED